MDFNIESIISSIAVFAGFISIVSTIMSVFIGYNNRKTKLVQAQEQKLNSALESDDLIKVGGFFYNTIGEFNIYEYVSSSNVSKTVDKFNEKLISFLKTDAEMVQEIKEIEEIEPIAKIETPPDLSEEFTKIHNELDSGEIWNALARLRRYIEITLRKTAEINDIHIDKATSAGYFVNLLTNHGVIRKEAAHNLKYAITISNKAIHGMDVDITEAHGAVFHASIGLNMLNMPSTAPKSEK